MFDQQRNSPFVFSLLFSLDYLLILLLFLDATNVVIITTKLPFCPRDQFSFPLLCYTTVKAEQE